MFFDCNIYPYTHEKGIFWGLPYYLSVRASRVHVITLVLLLAQSLILSGTSVGHGDHNAICCINEVGMSPGA